MRTGRPIPNSFCWRQHFFINILAIFRKKWRHVTSRDVIVSDFHQNFRKCFPSWCDHVVQIWRHLHHLNWSYEQLRIFPVYMGNIGNPIPPPDKDPISWALWGPGPRKSQEMCKTKFCSLKNQRRPSACAIFPLSIRIRLGGYFYPPHVK